jgi:hypothetical protein
LGLFDSNQLDKQRNLFDLVDLDKNQMGIRCSPVGQECYNDLIGSLGIWYFLLTPQNQQDRQHNLLILNYFDKTQMGKWCNVLNILFQ